MTALTSSPRNAADKPLVVFIMGATASGKTDLAMGLAQTGRFELINVDATQVYKGLNIGAAKPSAAELAKVPHRLIDIREPQQIYSVAEFRQDALGAINEIHQAGHTPLLVGGSMLYFKVLLEGLAAMPAADVEIRAQIEAEAERFGWPYMHAELAKVDAPTAARLHPNHSQRIARALEVYRVSGLPMSELHARQKQTSQDDLRATYQVRQLAIGLRDRNVLHQRIEQRFDAMLAAGLIDEVRALKQRGDLHGDLPAMRAAGYRQAWDYLEGKINYEEMRARGIAATRQLAKRQLTWLRRWPELYWLHGDEEPTLISDGAQGDSALNNASGTNKSQFLERALNYIETGTI